MKQGINPKVAIGVIAVVLIGAGLLIAKAFMTPDNSGSTESKVQYQQHMQQNQGALQSKMQEKPGPGSSDYAAKMKAYNEQNQNK